MRKFLFCVLILILCVVMYFIVWYDIPSLECVKTYTEIEDAYTDYQSVLKTLKNKNDSELPAVESKLDKNYSTSDTDNVVKMYNDNKKTYEDLVALQIANATLGSADIYDIEYIWTTIGKYASKNGLNLDMDVIKSEADLDSDDYVMCNLSFEVTGRYLSIAEFIDTIELDTNMAFQINDFFMEGYDKTARNQTKDNNMDTDNIPDSGNSGAVTTDTYSSDYQSYGSTGSLSGTSSENSHDNDVVASFKVYNIPLNRRNVTNIKSAEDLTSDSTSEDETEEY